MSPFGQTLARADSGPGGARLALADGRSFVAPDAESLTETVLGWRVPIVLLPAWLRGELAGARATAPGQTLDAVQSGWTVRVENDDAGRPARLALNRPGSASAPSVNIRLLLDLEETPAGGAPIR